MKRWAAVIAALFIIAVAIALRLPNLSARPLHNDEAVNALKVSDLWERGEYRYDPHEYHGPTLHYATAPFLALSGAADRKELTDAPLRFGALAFGLLLIPALLLFRGGISNHALLWAALFIAISPAMVFYSRYFIHEMLLIFFTATTIGCGWKYSETRNPVWAALVGASVGLMFATKETFVITLMAFGCAWFATRLLTSAATKKIVWRDLGIGVWVFVAVWILFFTSFFANWDGLADSIRTYFPWLKRAGGHSPHIHPWTFYFERLIWFQPVKGPVFSEAIIVALALVGGIASVWKRESKLHVFLASYTFAITCAYTIIPYKTPWCLLNFLFGMILLAGLGAAFLVERFKWPGVFILGLAAQLGWQAYRASHVLHSDRRNPYVYAQTAPDLLNLAPKLEAIIKSSPEGLKTVVKVIGDNGDYWPLPWYFRRFENVGWYEKMPDDPWAPIIIVSQKLEAALDERSEKKWVMIGYTELRPQRFLETYVELELWKRHVATLPPPKNDD